MKRNIILLILSIFVLGMMFIGCEAKGANPPAFIISNNSSKTVNDIHIEYEKDGEIFNAQLTQNMGGISVTPGNEQVFMCFLAPDNTPIFNEILNKVIIYSTEGTYTITLENVQTWEEGIEEKLTITDELWETE